MMQDEYFARPQNLWDEQVETGAVIPELESWYELNAYNDAIYHVFCERVEASAIPPPN